MDSSTAAANAPAGGAGNPFDAWKTLDLPGGAARVAGLRALAAATGRDLERLPYSIRVLLENGLRHCGRRVDLTGCDLYYLEQGIDRPMCCGEFLDWKAVDDA